MSKRIVSGVLIAIAAMAGIYAVAATTANQVAASFNPTESASRSRSIDVSTEIRRTLAEHKAARAKCALLPDPAKKACNAEAGAKERRGLKMAFQP